MKPEALASLPDWPAVMDVPTAELYLGGRGQLLQALRDHGYLTPIIRGSRRTCFRRCDIDTALSCAKSKNDPLT